MRILIKNKLFEKKIKKRPSPLVFCLGMVLLSVVESSLSTLRVSVSADLALAPRYCVAQYFLCIVSKRLVLRWTEVVPGAVFPLPMLTESCESESTGGRDFFEPSYETIEELELGVRLCDDFRRRDEDAVLLSSSSSE